MQKLCSTCGLRSLHGGTCPIFNERTPDDSCCPKYTSMIDFCDVCGNPVLTSGIIDYDEHNIQHLICSNCAFGPKCQICSHNDYCAFEMDASCHEPPMIIIQEQRGPMTFQSQQINPRRIELTCGKGCPCYLTGDGPHCARQVGGCINSTIRWRNSTPTN